MNSEQNQLVNWLHTELKSKEPHTIVTTQHFIRAGYKWHIYVHIDFRNVKTFIGVSVYMLTGKIADFALVSGNDTFRRDRKTEEPNFFSGYRQTDTWVVEGFKIESTLENVKISELYHRKRTVMGGLKHDITLKF